MIRDIKYADSGSHYFYAKIAERRHTNAIGSIVDIDGVVCKGQENVAVVFLNITSTFLDLRHRWQLL